MANRLSRRGRETPPVGAQSPDDQASEDVAQRKAEQSRTGGRTDGPDPPASSAESAGPGAERRFAALSARIGALVRAIQDNDEASNRGGDPPPEPLAADLRAARVRRRRVRDAVRRTQAARDQLAAHARADPPCDVDLAGDVRSQGSRAARQIVHRAPRPGSDPDRPADHRDHRRELLPQRRVRLRGSRPAVPRSGRPSRRRGII